jgi:hypothetical protein
VIDRAVSGGPPAVALAALRLGSRRRTSQISAQDLSVEKEGAVFQAGNIRPVLPEMNCDRDKFDPVACDWHKESRPRAA